MNCVSELQDIQNKQFVVLNNRLDEREMLKNNTLFVGTVLKGRFFHLNVDYSISCPFITFVPNEDGRQCLRTK